jgi:iron complex outermembrane recepter protein
MIKIYGFIIIETSKLSDRQLNCPRITVKESIRLFELCTMKVICVIGFFLSATAFSHAQEIDDSVKVLDPFTVQGYLYRRPASEVPASLALMSERQLERFNDVSILPVVNAAPGVRMEERSPGSYRLSIRGSSLRSPFGVRNVKIYWNGLPFTDAGGNTYLNLLDFSSMNRIEIVKGPAGSLYGAGTGGVVLLNTLPRKRTAMELSTVLGSYGLKRAQLRADLVTKNMDAIVNFSRTESDGYRDQSKLVRDALNAEWNFSIATTTTVSAKFLYTDIFYETPGGLTLEQFKSDPTLARPAAVEQNANVKNKTWFSGVTATHDWTNNLTSDLGIYVSGTDFKNFAVLNYEVRDELNSGFRLANTLVIDNTSLQGKIVFGAEYQSMGSPVSVYENNRGVQGQLMIDDDLDSRQTIVFGQAELDLPREFLITLGLSSSWVAYDFKRTFPEDDVQEKRFKAEFSPRLAVLKKFGPWSVYSSVSKGFSPPTLAEVRPSTNVFNNELQPEKGINYEVGVRRSWKDVTFDFTQYYFMLKETIIIDRTQTDSEFFVNAGETEQLGSELLVSWNASKIFNTWTSLTYNHYRFKDYGDYSGNKLTGVPPATAVIGADLTFPAGLYCNATYSYTGRIPLNDENSYFAEDYFLLNVRAGYRRTFGESVNMDFFVTVDNAFNEMYSLGNDLNSAAMNPRFYNPAPGRNYAAGLKVQFMKP